MSNKYDIYDQIAIAIREKTPFVIVESFDDRQIYVAILNTYLPDKQIDVFYVGEFEDYNNGCEFVIELIKKIQTDLANENVSQLVLGIIDRDTRPYIDSQARPYEEEKSWEKVQNLKGLFVLKYYSIETYFANVNSLKKLTCNITYALPKDLKPEIINHLAQSDEESLYLLYYIALDAFKEHYVGKEHYKAEKTFKDDELGSAVTKSGFLNRFKNVLLPQKQADLEAFALQKGININNAKEIIKGKWYLYLFVTNYHQQLEKLQALTTFPVSEVFKPKLIGNADDKIKHLYTRILECPDEVELADIIQKLRELGLKDVNNAS